MTAAPIDGPQVVEYAEEKWRAKPKVQGWLDALKKGENPFIKEVFEKLW